MRHAFYGRAAACLAVVALPLVANAQITDPLPPIPKGSIGIELQPVAAGLTAPNDLKAIPGDPNRLLVVDQSGQIQTLQNGVLQGQPFLDLSSRLVNLNAGYDERGLLGVALHPDFSNPASDGFGKLYTYSSEPVSGDADFTVPMPAGVAFNHQSVVSEWQVSASDPNSVDPASRREVMRIDQPQGNHNGGAMAFGPDGHLYISLGDGGAANDVANGHTPGIGNAQDTSNILGSMVRIDVDARTSANGQYGVPADNPFVGGAGVDEIFAYGFRNPFRFSFDSANGDLLVADVGQNQIEELNNVTIGGNYGWNDKEGTFLFDPTTGEITANSPGSPDGLLDPILQYDHDEGIAIIGGFVYHGSLLPELQGKYVFGDLSNGFGDPNGRLFYADLETGEINEFALGLDDRALGLYLKGFGQDANGELYVLGSVSLGPSGSTGQVLRIVPIPEPASLLSSLLVVGLSLRRRR